MNIYDGIMPEDILRIKQETQDQTMDTQARFKEIESLCQQLEMQMKSFPELRLGQLLSNALYALRCKPEEIHQRLFYIEDTELLKNIVEYVKFLISTTIKE